MSRQRSLQDCFLIFLNLYPEAMGYIVIIFVLLPFYFYNFNFVVCFTVRKIDVPVFFFFIIILAACNWCRFQMNFGILSIFEKGI